MGAGDAWVAGYIRFRRGELDHRHPDVERRISLSRSVMSSIGPSQTASTERGSPMATNGGRSNAERLSQHLANTSGPIPAGSPSEIAIGSEGAVATDAPLTEKIA